MSSLPHYLRTYRRRAGLSQDDLAYLLGSESGTKVSRYERSARKPTLETALAYEAVFGVPVRQLLAGLYERIERRTRRRAGRLAGRLAESPERRSRAAVALLRRILTGAAGQQQHA